MQKAKCKNCGHELELEESDFFGDMDNCPNCGQEYEIDFDTKLGVTLIGIELLVK